MNASSPCAVRSCRLIGRGASWIGGLITAALLLAPGMAQADRAADEAAYTALSCAGCHSHPPYMPDDQPILKNAWNILNNFGSPAHPTDETYLTGLLKSGKGKMPALSSVSTSDLDSIFRYLTRVRDGDLFGPEPKQPSSTSFDATFVGQSSAPQVLTLKNARHTDTTIGKPSVPTDFAIVPSTTPDKDCSATGSTAVVAGEYCTMAVVFRPASPGDKSDMLSVRMLADHNLTATAAATITLKGTALALGPRIKIDPPGDGRATFPDTLVGASLVRSWTVSNLGDQDLTLASVTLTGAAAAFPLVEVANTTPCTDGATVAPGKTCLLSAKFTPTGASPFNATATIAHNDSATGGKSAIELSGTGIAPLLQVTLSKEFATTLVGIAAPATVALKNIGSAPAALGSATIDAASFSVASACSSSTLAVSATCEIGLSFVSASPGDPTATLRVPYGSAAPQLTLSADLALSAHALKLSADPFALALAAAPGTSASASVSISNASDVAAVMGPVTLKPHGPFTFSNGCTGTLTKATAPCAIGVVYTPGVPAAATLNIAYGPDATHGVVASIDVPVTGKLPAPDIQTSSMALEFGDAPVGGAGQEQSLVVRNIGSAPLQFKAIATSGSAVDDFHLGGNCAVTTPIAPNASCIISVGFAPAAPGGRAAQLDIQSNAARGPVTLALRGRGTGGARVVPALKVSHTVLDFGLVWVNASPTTQRTILLRNSGDTEIHFEGIAQTGPFDLGNDCGASLGPHFWCRIFVTMHPNGGAPLNGQITIISDAPNAPGTVTVTGQGTAAPASTLQWTQAPSSPLEFGNAYVGGATTRSLVMVNTGPMLVHISGVSITSGSDVQDFSAAGGSCLSGPLAPGAFCDVTVDFAPQSAGVKLAAIRIAADAAPPADMVLAGTGIGPPPLALVPSSMNFGDVTVGQKSQPMTIELRNNGSTLLHIGGIEANGPFQQLAGNCPPPPITVGPHSSACQLRLVYSPLGTGMATGTLVVRSDSPETSALVPLTGSGIAPPKATRERRSARRDPTGPIQNTTRAGPAL